MTSVRKVELRPTGDPDHLQTFADEHDRRRLSGPAVRAFRKLTERWALGNAEASALLGVSPSSWDRVKRAARLRLYEVSPAEAPGTLEHEVWQSVLALEDALSDESATTKRLSRTRQKIGRDGEHKTVCDLIMSKPSPGFAMLVNRNMVELTFEAVALRFPGRFDPEVLAAAERRLRVAVTSWTGRAS